MLKAASGQKGLLPYTVIAAAVRGESDAVNMVIRHYSGYIAAHRVGGEYEGREPPLLRAESKERESELQFRG